MEDHEGYWDWDNDDNPGGWVWYKDTYGPSPLKGMFVHDSTGLVVFDIKKFEDSALFKLIHTD